MVGKNKLRLGRQHNIVVNYCCKRKLQEKNETEETIGFFVEFLSLVTYQSGKRGWPSGPPKYAYELGSLVLEMRKLSATSEAELIHRVVRVWVRNHPGQKQRLFLPFGNKFKFGRKGARRLR